jgi:hypothetical protein
VIYEGNIAVFAKQNCLPKGLGLQCGATLKVLTVCCKEILKGHCHNMFKL